MIFYEIKLENSVLKEKLCCIERKTNNLEHSFRLYTIWIIVIHMNLNSKQKRYCACGFKDTHIHFENSFFKTLLKWCILIRVIRYEYNIVSYRIVVNTIGSTV